MGNKELFDTPNWLLKATCISLGGFAVNREKRDFAWNYYTRIVNMCIHKRIRFKKLLRKSSKLTMQIFFFNLDIGAAWNPNSIFSEG